MTDDRKIVRRSISAGTRMLVTSDIHGHLNYLIQVLKKAGFCDDDLLIVVGDIIEKGPESLKTLRYVMDLYQNGNVAVLIGNVDLLRMQMIEGIDAQNAGDFYQYLLSQRRWKGSSIFDEMAAECKLGIGSAEDVLNAKATILAHFQPEFDFLRSLPVILETQNYIFVHGGIPQEMPDRIHPGNIFRFLKYERFMDTERCFDKYVVVGHWPVSLYNNKISQTKPIIDERKKIISIDGGCGLKTDGQLNLIEIPDIGCSIDQIKTYSYDGLPQYEAVEDQPGSTDSINITWCDNRINKLEVQDDFTYVEHIGSGKRLWVPNDLIHKEHQCGDYTDYVLPVNQGDVLSVIKSTSKGYIVKKDGVTGWYYGKLKPTD